MAKKAARKPKRRGSFRLSKMMVLFAAEYPRDLNAKQAAIRAGLSPSHAASTASDWLKRPAILEMVNAGIEARRERCGIQVERVLENLAATASADLRDYFNADGKFIGLALLPAHVTYAIEQLEFHENGKVRKVKLKDSHQALTLLVKYLKLLKADDPKAGEGGDLASMTPEQLEEELANIYAKAQARKLLPDVLATAVKDDDD